MEAFKRVILETSPESFALQTVQKVIKPQKQTKLTRDENQLLENILRMLLQDLVSSTVDSGEPIMQYGQLVDDSKTSLGYIPRFLDFVLYLCEKENIEGGMIFQLLEDLTEMSTMRNRKDVFGFIETKQDILGKQELFARGKLVMLRMCNHLLRQLPMMWYSVDASSCFWLISSPFQNVQPLISNVYLIHLTRRLMKRTHLQEYFVNPASLTNAPMKWQKFTSNLMVVLSTFEAEPLSEKVGESIDMEEEAANFGINYLTSSKVMGLELKDSSFHRHILVQCLIVFNYLKSPGKTDKDLPSDSMKEEIKVCEDRVKKLLEMTLPEGKDFLFKIEQILEREKNWVWWKRDGCPPFEKQPIERKSVPDSTKKALTAHQLKKHWWKLKLNNCAHTCTTCLRRPRWRLGNKELSQLWKWADQNPNTLTDPHRMRTPAVMDNWKPLAEDMDASAGIEAKYHHKNSRLYCWKGLRLSARQNLEGFSRFTHHGIEGAVPLELLPADVRSKYQVKPNERSKRAKKDEVKSSSQQVEEIQLAQTREPDGEAKAAPMDTEMLVHANNIKQDENQRQNFNQDVFPEAGQLEADAGAEKGAAHGKTDAEIDLDTVG